MSSDIESLYFELLRAWNARDAARVAALFTVDGALVGFDGSEVAGRAAIEAHLAPIFASHRTPVYIVKIHDNRTVAADTALLRAAAGLIPEGKTTIDPALTAIQSLLAAREGGQWRIVLFQNTPLAWHGRDAERAALNDELDRQPRLS